MPGTPHHAPPRPVGKLAIRDLLSGGNPVPQPSVQWRVAKMLAPDRAGDETGNEAQS
jgi:hypothetical protein